MAFAWLQGSGSCLSLLTWIRLISVQQVNAALFLWGNDRSFEKFSISQIIPNAHGRVILVIRHPKVRGLLQDIQVQKELIVFRRLRFIRFLIGRGALHCFGGSTMSKIPGSSRNILPFFGIAP
jgi:hypothetical protein